MQTVMATMFSCELNIFACTPTKSCTAVAWLGLLGSLDSLSPVRKLLQPKAPSTSARETAATLIERVMGRSPRLMVQGNGEHERPRLRIAEIFRSLNRIGGSAAARLRIVAGPLRPGPQVPAGETHVDAQKPERSLNPGRVERVADRDLAQLDVAVLLDACLFHARERARRVALPIPVLTDRDGRPRAGAHDRAVEPAALSEHLRVAGACRAVAGRPLVGVLVRPVAPQGTLDVVRHRTAVPDVEEPGDLELAVTERAPHAPGPPGIRVGEDALVRVGDWEARRVNVHRASRSPGAGCTDRAA